MCLKAGTPLSKLEFPCMVRLFSHLYPGPQTPLTILSLDLSSSFRKAIIPVLPTSTPRLQALEIKGSLFMTDKNPSEIESLLVSYPDGFTEHVTGMMSRAPCPTLLHPDLLSDPSP